MIKFRVFRRRPGAFRDDDDSQEPPDKDRYFAVLVPEDGDFETVKGEPVGIYFEE